MILGCPTVFPRNLRLFSTQKSFSNIVPPYMYYWLLGNRSNLPAHIDPPAGNSAKRRHNSVNLKWTPSFLFLSSLPPTSLLPLSFLRPACDGLIWRIRPPPSAAAAAITVGRRRPISIRAIASGIQRAGQGFHTPRSKILSIVTQLTRRLYSIVE